MGSDESHTDETGQPDSKPCFLFGKFLKDNTSNLIIFGISGLLCNALVNLDRYRGLNTTLS